MMMDEEHRTSEDDAPLLERHESIQLQPPSQISAQSSNDTVPSQSTVHGLLFTSHFLSTWNSRLFEFGAFLFLASLYSSTLLPASVYALARAAAAAIIAPWFGDMIDRTSRLKVVRLSIAGQRIPVMLTCAVFAVLFHFDEFRTSRAGFVVALLVLSLLACVEKLSIVANTIAVERDWVVVIAGTDEDMLTRLNSRMRRIDLFCKLVAPLAISLLDAYSTIIAIIATGALSAASCLIEYLAIARVYHAVPSLRRQKSNEGNGSENLRTSIFDKLKGYVLSPALLPSLALSILYFTSLSFSGQLITYLLAPPQSMSALLVSVVRGLAACAELSATFLGPRLITRIGALRAGSWFLNAQLLFVILAAASLWLNTTLLVSGQVTILVTAVIFSRVGLWGFDLAAQQQVQDAVPETSRGSFSSVEAALQNVFEMLSFASTIIWARPEQFKLPGTLSAAAVVAAAILYALFVRQRRGHLLHLDQACCGSKYWQTHFGNKQRADRGTFARLASGDDETVNDASLSP